MWNRPWLFNSLFLIVGMSKKDVSHLWLNWKCPKIVFCSVSQQESKRCVSKQNIFQACRMGLSHHNGWWEIISMSSSAAGNCLSCRPADTSDHFTQCNISIRMNTLPLLKHTHLHEPPLLEFCLVEFLLDVGLRTGMGSRRQEMSDHRPHFPPNPASQENLRIHRGNEAERHLSPPGFWCGELFGYCGHLFIL